MRRYFAVYAFDYNKVLEKAETLTTNDFAFSHQGSSDFGPSLSYLVSENKGLSEWLLSLEYTKEMTKEDLLIEIHKNVEDYFVIGNVNMVREGGI